MHQLILSSAFVRQLKRLLRRNPQLRNKVKRTLHLLAKDINHPSLGLHKLSGENNWSVSVTQDIRIIVHWEKVKLFCTRIGTHDQVY